MPDWFKVAAWEIKRNLTNKSFLISMLLTPVLMIVFGALPSLMMMLETERIQTVYVIDDIGLYNDIKPLLPDNITLIHHKGGRAEAEEIVHNTPDTSFVVLDQNMIAHKSITVHTAQDGFPELSSLEIAINTALRNRRFSELGLDEQIATELLAGYRFAVVSLEAVGEDPVAEILSKIIPAIFAGLLLFSIAITGTMTFQSAAQEKKDKMAELLLSSTTPYAIMQGKILGYFVLGLAQAALWMLFALPIAILQFDIPVFDFLFVPVLPVMLFFTLVGNLMFSALFVSMGATIEDIQEAGNFQGTIMILPWTPFFFISPVIANPNGLIALITSYFPLTSPGVMTIRLAMLDKIPVADVVISAILLLIFTWLIMKLSGKIFKTGMLMYGKNATPAEIWKWIRY